MMIYKGIVSAVRGRLVTNVEVTKLIYEYGVVFERNSMVGNKLRIEAVETNVIDIEGYHMLAKLSDVANYLYNLLYKHF